MSLQVAGRARGLLEVLIAYQGLTLAEQVPKRCREQGTGRRGTTRGAPAPAESAPLPGHERAQRAVGRRVRERVRQPAAAQLL